jgi:transcriptional regulator with XRE-family HTH domain
MVAETFGQRLKRLRLRRGLSQRKLASAAGLSNGAISQAESEDLWIGQLPSYDIMRRLASALDVTREELAGEGGEADETEKKPRRRYTREEIYRNIGAYPVTDSAIFLEQQASAGKGKGALIPQGLEGVETVPAIAGKQLYAMRITGSCMDPELKPGDIVHFEPDRIPEDGDLVVATQYGEKALVKWYEEQGTMQYLVPLEGEAILIDESIEVIGVIKKIERTPPRRTNAKRKRTVNPLQRPLLDE